MTLLHLFLTCAPGWGSWPGAIGLAQSDAGTLEVKLRQTSYTAGGLEVVVADVLDEKAIFWRGQHWAVHHWDNRREQQWQIKNREA